MIRPQSKSRLVEQFQLLLRKLQSESAVTLRTVEVDFRAESIRAELVSVA